MPCMMSIRAFSQAYACQAHLRSQAATAGSTVPLRNPAKICKAHRLSPGDLLQAAARRGGTRVAEVGGQISSRPADDQRPIQVVMKDGNVIPGPYHFTARGHDWSLNVISEGSKVLKLEVVAVNSSSTSKWERTDVIVTPSLLVKGVEVVKTGNRCDANDNKALWQKHTFSPASPSIVVGMVHTADIDPEVESMLKINIKVPAPSQSRKGDAELVIESGEAFRVHSALLELSSAVMAAAIASGGPQPGDKALSLLLPGVSSKQALILLRALYAMPAAIAWADKQTAGSLRELASISHALDCKGLLSIADGALVKQSSSCITADNCIELYRQARQLGISGFQNECAGAIIRFLPDITLRTASAGDDGLIPVLCKAKDQANSNQAAQLLAIDAVCGKVDELANSSDSYYRSERRELAATIRSQLQAVLGTSNKSEAAEPQADEQDDEKDEDEDEHEDDYDDYWDDDD